MEYAELAEEEEEEEEDMGGGVDMRGLAWATLTRGWMG
jgi:hypothetical protein